jgi:ankyrin repeat protein
MFENLIYAIKTVYMDDTDLLIWACENGYLDILNKLLNSDCPIRNVYAEFISTKSGLKINRNRNSYEVFSPIVFAACNGHLHIVKRLLPINILYCDKALQCAVANNHIDIVKFLLDSNIGTPIRSLFYAGYYCRLEILDILLKHSSTHQIDIDRWNHPISGLISGYNEGIKGPYLEIIDKILVSSYFTYNKTYYKKYPDNIIGDRLLEDPDLRSGHRTYKRINKLHNKFLMVYALDLCEDLNDIVFEYVW